MKNIVEREEKKEKDEKKKSSNYGIARYAGEVFEILEIYLIYAQDMPNIWLKIARYNP